MEDKPKDLTSYHLIRHATLRQIQIFEAVARNLSFTRTAEQLYLTQPTVSAQVKAFCESLGMPLYEQVGRKIYLTEAGVLAARSCREVIDALANLEMSIADLRGLRRGRLRLTVVTTAKYFAPVAMGEFAKSYPDIELELSVVNRQGLLSRLEENMSDLYISGQVPPSNLELNVIPFAPNPLVVIAPRGHPLVGEKNISLERLADEPFIMREKGSGIRSAVEKEFSSHGLAINERLVLDSNEAIKHAVVGGLGLAVVSRHALNLEGEDSPIAVLNVEGFPLKRQWNIVYPVGKELSVIARKFLEFLQEKGTSYIELS